MAEKSELICFKLVTHDLKSVGLLKASKLQYKVGEWVYPLEPLSRHRLKGGGLHVVKKMSDVRWRKKYVEKEHGTVCRVFTCYIGKILFENTCRIKTSKVMLLEEVT